MLECYRRKPARRHFLGSHTDVSPMVPGASSRRLMRSRRRLRLVAFVLQELRCDRSGTPIPLAMKLEKRAYRADVAAVLKQNLLRIPIGFDTAGVAHLERFVESQLGCAFPVNSAPNGPSPDWRVPPQQGLVPECPQSWAMRCQLDIDAVCGSAEQSVSVLLGVTLLDLFVAACHTSRSDDRASGRVTLSSGCDMV